MLKVPRCLAPLNKKVKVKGWLTECPRGTYVYILSESVAYPCLVET